MMSGDSTMLETVDSLLGKCLQYGAEADQLSELRTLLPQDSKQDVPSIIIQPQPGFCVVYKDIDNKKTFINICHSDDIPSPPPITVEELELLWETEDEVKFAIPMSVGQPRKEICNSGNHCDVYDVAVNSEFCEKARSDVHFRDFLLGVIFGYLKEKYRADLTDVRHTRVLKRKSAMGCLQTHRVQRRKVPHRDGLIEEMTDASSQPPADATSQPVAPIFELAMEAGHIVGTFQLPGARRENVVLEVSDDRVVLHAPTPNETYLLDIFLPYTVERDLVRAEFDCSKGVLTATLPVVVPKMPQLGS